jgi:hypothetical protein
VYLALTVKVGLRGSNHVQHPAESLFVLRQVPLNFLALCVTVDSNQVNHLAENPSALPHQHRSELIRAVGLGSYLLVDLVELDSELFSKCRLQLQVRESSVRNWSALFQRSRYSGMLCCVVRVVNLTEWASSWFERLVL